jgi:hypothetical protein
MLQHSAFFHPVSTPELISTQAYQFSTTQPINNQTLPIPPDPAILAALIADSRPIKLSYVTHTFVLQRIP